jgi:hypothetical protein
MTDRNDFIINHLDQCAETIASGGYAKALGLIQNCLRALKLINNQIVPTLFFWILKRRYRWL